MKAIALLGVAGLALGVAGCNGSGVTVTAGTIAQIVSHSSQACSDIQALGADVATVAGQVGAANPNSAAIQNAASQVTSGVATTNASCQQLAASFRAEAPASQLHRQVKLSLDAYHRLFAK